MKKNSIKILLAFLCFTLVIACRKNNNDNNGDNNNNPEGTWTEKASLPQGKERAYATGFSLNNMGYVFGGRKSTPSDICGDLWQYNPNTNTWTEKAGLPIGKERISASSFVLNGKAYVCAGKMWPDVALRDLWEYDPSTDQWTEKASLPEGKGRWAAVSFDLNGKAYITTGYNHSGYINNGAWDDLWEYDPVNNTWTEKASLSGDDRHIVGAAGFALNGKGYVAGGYEPGSLYGYDNIFEYDPVDNEWTKKKFLLETIQNSYIPDDYFVLKNKAYTIGGRLEGKDFTGVLEYNPADNNWLPKNYFSDKIKREGLSTFVIGDKAYVVGGFEVVNNVYNTSKRLWEFTID